MANEPFEPIAALPEMERVAGHARLRPAVRVGQPGVVVVDEPDPPVERLARRPGSVNDIVVQSGVAQSSPPRPWIAASCQ